MYRRCPKCGYVRQVHDTALESQCPACGLIFIKWLKQQLWASSQASARSRQPERITTAAPWLGRLEDALL